jgi:GNAT superfamily N-acetyltransferase
MFRIERMPLSPKHRPRIAEILRAVVIFTEEEVRVALDLVDRNLAGEKDYQIHVGVDNTSNASGYVCFGKRALTVGVYDLFWIVVDPLFQHLKLGYLLLESVEDVVKQQGGRMILAETSSRSVYRGARAFYSTCGFKEVASICNFYRPGDSLLIYQKLLNRPSNFLTYFGDTGCVMDATSRFQ